MSPGILIALLLSVLAIGYLAGVWHTAYQVTKGAAKVAADALRALDGADKE